MANGKNRKADQDHVTSEERAFRERCYENGGACGFLPFETAKRMGFEGDFDPQTGRQLYPESASGGGKPWC